jgi:hypothetical protein
MKRKKSMKTRNMILLASLAALGWFTLLPEARAVSPAPDGCYPNFTTAEGCDALSSLTTGAGNTGLGWRALFTDSTGNFNTGVGVGALVLNNSDSNTAVGAAALLLNTSGAQNTAVGAAALVFNSSGNSNTATGFSALSNNTSGGANTAAGWEALMANVDGVNNVAVGTLPLSSNTSGNNNTAVGNLALDNSISTSEHVAVGRLAGSGITTVNNNIIIGHHDGVHSRFGQEDNVCYIGNIWGANVDDANPLGPARMVLVDPDGRLGTMPIGADGNPVQSSGIQPQAIPDGAKQAVVDIKVQELRATVAQQQQQIETLTTQLNENTAEIQKANAQLETNKPPGMVVANKAKALPSRRARN